MSIQASVIDSRFNEIRYGDTNLAETKVYLLRIVCDGGSCTIRVSGLYTPENRTLLLSEVLDLQNMDANKRKIVEDFFAKQLKTTLVNYVANDNGCRNEQLQSGVYVHHHGFGTGVIERVDTENSTVEINFDGRNHSMSFNMAIHSLDFSVLKKTDVARFRRRQIDTVELFRLLADAHDGMITFNEIKKDVGDILVPRGRFFVWLENAVVNIFRDSHFYWDSKNGESAIAYSSEPICECGDNSFQIIPPEYVIHIRRSQFANICSRDRHCIESFRTYIPIKAGNDISRKEVFVTYCYKCREFYVDAEEFDRSLAAYGTNLLRKFISTDGKIWGYDNCVGSGRLATESILKYNGYNVGVIGGLTAEMRRHILDAVINYGIVEASRVQNYLRYFINFNGNAGHNGNARQKWEEDYLYIRTMYSLPLSQFFCIRPHGRLVN